MKKIVVLATLLVSGPLYAQQQELKLWYNKPAGKTWEAALPRLPGRWDCCTRYFGQSEAECPEPEGDHVV